ncbi:MAG: outer membrane protein transport protein [Epsilonproteobacteria bacterium]|nr:outer membrane protein transport protein [Campylobacterota bacterium]
MKSNIKLITALAVVSTSLYATNGDHLIGIGAKSLGMAGTGIAISHGAESALSNPALITAVKGNEISFGGTMFMPDVQTNTGSGFEQSDADFSVIPAVSLAMKGTDNFYWGVGMWGTAGMGVDYRGTGANSDMVTNLQLMQFGLPLAYTDNGFSIGITPILQYGSLDMSYNIGGAPSKTKGVAQDLAFGYTVGTAYTASDVTLGLVYKSPIKMTYDGQISVATGQFGLGALGFTDVLEQPSEMGAGIAYEMGRSVIALDYKRINWASAAGYKDFGWKDQDVFAIGYQHSQDAWAIRAGYNYAKSPIVNNANGTINMLNLLGFPATVESHYAVGGSYSFTKKTSVDVAYVYAPEASDTLGNTSTKHSQSALSMQVTFDF